MAAALGTTSLPTYTATTFSAYMAAIAAELVAARDGQVDLDTRIAALAAAVSGPFTLINGLHGLGVITLVVDSTVGFTTGAYVGYVRSDGVYEERQIIVENSTVLTVAATGGAIADNTPLAQVPDAIREGAAAVNHPAGTHITLPQAVEYAAQNIYNVQAYGAVGDSSSDDTAAFQATVDAAYAAGGGVVFVPPLSGGNFYKVTDAVYVKDNVHVAGGGYASYIKNTNTVAGAPAAHETSVFRFGGYDNPSTANGIDKETYYACSDGIAGDYRITLTTAAQSSNFAAGDILFIRSVNETAGGVPERHEINECIEVDSGNGYLYLKYPLGLDIGSGYGGLQVGTIGGSILEPGGEAATIVRKAGLANLRLENGILDYFNVAATDTASAVISYGGMFECTLENLWIKGNKGLYFNGTARCLFRNLNIRCFREAIDTRYFCNHNRFENCNFNRSETGTPGTGATVYFNEYSHHQWLTNCIINSGRHATRAFNSSFSHDSIITGNRFSNGGNTGRCVELNGSRIMFVRNELVCHSGQTYGIYVTTTLNSILRANQLKGAPSTAGIFVDSTSTGNKILDNDIPSSTIVLASAVADGDTHVLGNTTSKTLDGTADIYSTTAHTTTGNKVNFAHNAADVATDATYYFEASGYVTAPANTINVNMQLVVDTTKTMGTISYTPATSGYWSFKGRVVVPGDTAYMTYECMANKGGTLTAGASGGNWDPGTNGFTIRVNLGGTLDATNTCTIYGVRVWAADQFAA